MATTYPLTLPTVTGARSVNLRAINAVALSQSPFTFAAQSQAFSGQMWAADVSLPPMKRSDAAVWVSWLVSLRGQYGTFLMGDPLCATAQGEAGGTPIASGSNPAGETLYIGGTTVSQTDWLKAGDYIQIGTGANARLHQVLEDVDTDASGNATLSLWPHTRSAVAPGTAIVVSSPVGRWRLDGNQSEWSINEAAIYGISFSAVEAI